MGSLLPLLLVVLFGASPLWAFTSGDGSGLKISAVADLLGSTGGAVAGGRNRLEVRSAEVSFYSPVDHLFHGMLTLAAHVEPEGAYFEVHEAYLGSTRLIPRTRFRVGLFFLGIGRLNRFHRHDWPFISAPKVHADFFDEEGVLDAGGEVSVLLPVPFFWDLTIGVTNGWTFGHSHSLGKQPDIPTHYLRSAHYSDVPGAGGVEVGLNYLGRRNESGTHFHYAGADAAAKWRRGKRLKWLVQSEVWTRRLAIAGAPGESALGGYLYAQYGITPAWYAGIRGDFYTNLTLKDAGGSKVSNGTYAVVPTLTLRPSEFSVLRAAYTMERDRPGSFPSQTSHGFEFQITFIMGAHAAHDF